MWHVCILSCPLAQAYLRQRPRSTRSPAEDEFPPKAAEAGLVVLDAAPGPDLKLATATMSTAEK